MLLAGAFALGSASGCGSPAVRAADRGDRAALRSAWSDKHTRGELGWSEVQRVAKAVAEHEVATAKGDDAVARVRELRGCARPLDAALAKRAKGDDEAAAEAALVRLESGEVSPRSLRERVGDRAPAWRAVGARALVRSGGDDRAPRHAAMKDPDPRVRRAAMRAAAEAHDPADEGPLFDAARLDPDPWVRADAVRAYGRTARREDVGRRLARLRDLWVRADELERQDIAVALGLSPLREAGGEALLEVRIAEGGGEGALAAAAVAARSPGVAGPVSASAAALLARTIASAPRVHRLHAIAVAPLGSGCAAPGGGCVEVAPAIVAALEAAAAEEDRAIRVSALSRLTESPKHREAAIRTLEALASVEGSAGVSARDALARAGHLPVQAWVERDLASPNPHERVLAASALASLGRAGRAAPLLWDDDPTVRTKAACILVSETRKKP